MLLCCILDVYLSFLLIFTESLALVSDPTSGRFIRWLLFQTSDVGQERVRKMATFVLDTWTGLGLHYILSLYDSMLRRIRCVLRSRGQITKYHSFKVRKLLLLHEMLLYKFQFSAKMFITYFYVTITDGHVTIWFPDHLSDHITDADEACRSSEISVNLILIIAFL
jgi:hypothetical protein